MTKLQILLTHAFQPLKRHCTIHLLENIIFGAEFYFINKAPEIVKRSIIGNYTVFEVLMKNRAPFWRNTWQQKRKCDTFLFVF
jgi:hypothetical protein